MRHLDLFSGIGGFSLAASWIWGSQHELVSFCERDEFCQRVLKKHWPDVPCISDIHDVRGDEIGTVDLLTGGFPCFVAGTKINTDKGNRPIEEISIGEKVFTHNRNYKRVISVMQKQEAETFWIKCQGIPEPLCATGEHPFYVRRQKTRMPRTDNGRRKRIRTFLEPEWATVNQLKKGMYVGYPVDIINDEQKEYRNKSFWYLVGRYLGDGWIVNHKRTSKIPQGHRGSRINSKIWKVLICTAKNDTDNLYTKIQEAGFHATIVEDRTVVKFHISDKDFVEFLQNFGKYAHGKFLPEMCFHLPYDYQMALFQGWCDSDGYVDKNGSIKVTTVSKQLSYDMARIARNAFKRPVSITKHKVKDKTTIEGRIVKQRQQYRVTVDHSSRYGFYEDGYIWMPFKWKRANDIKQPVYNLEVEDDNSYTADGIAVHNCQPFSVAGKRRGSEDDRYLWPQMLRVIQEVQPRWVLGENVPGIVNLALDAVLADLEGEGYEVQTFLVPACGVNAPHRRNRVWIVANRHGQRQQEQRQPVANAAQFAGVELPRKSATDAQSAECELSRNTRERRTGFANGRCDDERSFSDAESEQAGRLFKRGFPTNLSASRDWTGQTAAWSTQSPFCGVADGVSSKLDGIARGLGYENSNSQEAIAAIDQFRREVLRSMREYETTPTASQRIQRRVGGYTLPGVSQRIAYEGWNLGGRIEANERLCNLWKTICSKPFDETQDLQQELLLRIRQKECNETLGKDRTNRLRSLGNAIVPQVAAVFFDAMKHVDLLYNLN